MVTNEPKHILVAPLDWGLGHTTRCVPLIRHLLHLGHVPVFAGNKVQSTLIEDIFGSIDIVPLEGYNVTYSKWNRLAQAGLLSQVPQLKKQITREHDWLYTLASQRKIDGIISDNRYGLYHKDIPSVMLTHQLQVRTGWGSFADLPIRKIHYGYLRHFHNIWVVDDPAEPGLAGTLSHPSAVPAGTRYIGLLSVFGPGGGHVAPKTPDDPLLILISGPEPQRTDFSRMLWQQALNHKGNVIFVEGTTNAKPPFPIPAHIQYHQRVAGKYLESLIVQARMIICRSGYSTIMDLIRLNKKAILIPTPAQTEQDYLAKQLHHRGIFFADDQKGFNLDRALTHSIQFPFHNPGLDNSYTIHQKILADWVAGL